MLSNTVTLEPFQTIIRRNAEIVELSRRCAFSRNESKDFFFDKVTEASHDKKIHRTHFAYLRGVERRLWK